MDSNSFTNTGSVLAAILLLILLTGISCNPDAEQDAAKSNSVAETASELEIAEADAQELADSVDIPLDIAFSLLKLQRRFGESDPVLVATGSLMLGLMSEEQHDNLRESIRKTENALQNSYAGRNLGAPPAPTGDRLFDRYAEAVWQQIDSISVSDITSDSTFHAAALPDSVVAGWEDEFGDDPRYWELRYFCAYMFVGSNPLAGNFEARTDFLRHAVDSGAATVNTILILYEELTPETATNVYDPDYGVFNPDAGALPLLDKSTAMEPDNCWPRYYRALHSYRSGNTESAMTNMERGNEAELAEYPRPFPLAYAGQYLTQNCLPPGNAVVSGAIFMAANDYRIPNNIQWKRFQKEVLLDYSGLPDGDALNSWQQFACDFAQANQSDSMPTLVSLVFVLRNGDCILEDQSVTLTSEQKEVIHRTTGAKEFALDKYKQRAVDSAVFEATEVLSMAGGAKGLFAAIYLDAESIHRVNVEIEPVFNDLREMDYVSLDPVPALLKYEALTKEEIIRRREEKKAGNPDEYGLDDESE